MQTRIPCVMMRGGTSKGPFFLADDLPAEREVFDRVLLAAMGSPDKRQIDGIGGADTLTSKVAIVSRSSHPGADVDYLFAQVSVEEAVVDTNPNCGNMLSGIGPFAIEKGLVKAQDGETVVRIYNVNTKGLIEASVQTPGGQVRYDGDTAIDGVPGTAAPISLNFTDAVGSKTGKLLPTGKPLDVIDGIAVSCVDVAMPMVIARASDFGKTGYETKAELDADKDMLAKMEAIRLKASVLMGMGDAKGKVVPKFGLVAAPRDGGSITSRYFVPHNCHAAHAVTGGLCLAATCGIPGTVTEGIAVLSAGPRRTIVIEHPSGKLGTEFEMAGTLEKPVIKRASFVRTARPLFEGYVLVPASVWDGKKRVAKAAE